MTAGALYLFVVLTLLVVAWTVWFTVTVNDIRRGIRETNRLLAAQLAHRAAAERT